MKLSQQDKEVIIAVVQAKTATMKQLAARYGVSQPRISQVFKKITGSALHPRKAKGKQESHLSPTPYYDTRAIPLREVLRTVAELNKENPHYPFSIEIKLKDQIVSIRL